MIGCFIEGVLRSEIWQNERVMTTVFTVILFNTAQSGGNDLIEIPVSSHPKVYVILFVHQAANMFF